MQTHSAVRGQRCWSQLGRQTDPEGRAHRLQGGPPAPLAAEHAALQHCSQQLPGLEDRETADAPSPAAGEPREMGLCNEDWEATASSSSSDGDDDPEVDRSQQQRSSSKRRRDNQASPTSSEVSWLVERAEMGSRWSWLLLRLTEVEARVRHLVDLHKRLHSTKIGVVLGDTQPLTDQQARARGGDLPWDADYEPSSPAHLLRNIERQSAQLSQIVTSLSPFLLAPLQTNPYVGGCRQESLLQLERERESRKSEGPCRPVLSDQGAHGKRRRPGIRGRHRLLQASLKGWCARARPLLTYHKHRLFTMEEPGTGALQDNRSTSPPYSSSCEPGALCSQPTCRSTTGPGGSLTCGTSHSKLHPVLYCSREQMDSPSCSHLQRAPSGERWSQRPMAVNVAEPCDPTLPRDGPRHSGHRRRHRATPRGGVSPRWTDFCRTPHKRASRRRSKRRRALTFIEDEESLSYLLCGRQEISELLEEACTQYPKHTCRLASQRPVHRQQGETVYGINNIILPMSLALSAKVERRPYKHILTPSWRLVNMQSSQDMGGEEEEVEVVTDETFLQRHLEPEQREALRRSSWSKRRGCRRSAWPASEEGPCSSGEEESTMEASSALLETDEHPGTEEKLMPASPWEPRLFPLAEAPEEAPPTADVKESTSFSRAGPLSWPGPLSQAGPLSILSSSGASLGPSAGQNRNSMLPLCSC
ncbi:KAT8 regulatory NSL complex subunit 1-like protein [Merluccius polli]|uniref:KAT8 regulatory NSL complex subunit 1-like protein n=1 Tax=Merluccius polli TaxID=89951 RepID=A0AA47N911_MERPO|nr:KAT8 regulatory NSL complex subunit 1-like protein [Merluccius polli]